MNKSATPPENVENGFNTDSSTFKGEIVELDGSVYPDVAPPTGELSEEDMADYIDRICGVWDFGLRPEPETVRFLENCREVFDKCPLPRSPAYHTFRLLYGWPTM